MSEKQRIPPAIGRLEETISIIEEIDARLRHIKDSLSQTTEEAARLDGKSIRDLFDTLERIGLVIDEAEVEVDVLETRISTIEDLKGREK